MSQKEWCKCEWISTYEGICLTTNNHHFKLTKTKNPRRGVIRRSVEPSCCNRLYVLHSGNVNISIFGSSLIHHIHKIVKVQEIHVPMVDTEYYTPRFNVTA